MLNATYITDFWKNGYLVVRSLFSTSEIAALYQHLDILISEVGRTHANRLLNLTGRSPIFLALVKDSRIVTIARQLIGSDIAFHHSKVHWGQPNIHWHQDFTSYPHTNSSIVTFSLYMDAVDSQHGALRVVPGSHIEKLPFTSRILGATLSPEDYESRAESLQMRPGDLCVHHSLLIHRPSACDEDRQRTVVLLTYRAADACMLVPNTFQEQHSGELVSGSESVTFRTDSKTLIVPRQSVSEDGSLIFAKRDEALRIRGQRVGMM